MDELKITLWDTDTQRIDHISRKLYAAMKEKCCKGKVSVMSEPPMVARMNMIDKIPALEIDGKIWTQDFEEEFSYKDCLRLVGIILSGTEQRYMHAKNN